MSDPIHVFQCTKDHPWDKKKRRQVRHIDAHEVGEQRDGWPGGDWVTYICPNCGHKWDSELPQ